MWMINPYEKKKDEIYGAETYLREAGYYITKLEKYHKALKYFDKAIETSPDDQRALMGRSKCRAKLSQYKGALEDIKYCESLYPDDIHVLTDKAHNTYLCSEFEDGLLQNVKLTERRHLRGVMGAMDSGRMECVQAIENSVGVSAGQPMLDHFKIIRKLGWKYTKAALKPFEPTPTNKPKHKLQFFKETFEKLERSHEPIQPRRFKRKRSHSSVLIKDSLHSIKTDPGSKPPPYFQPIPFKPVQSYTSNIENYMAEKYLDTMYLDKIFLKELVHEPKINCPSNTSTTKLRNLAKSCYKNVSYKQELLRHRRPFYFIRYNDASVTSQLKERQKIELQHQQKVTQIEANLILEKMNAAFKNKQLQQFLAFVEQLIRYCDGKPKRLLPNKEYYKQTILDSIGQAFYDVYRLNTQKSLFDQHRRIYVILGLPLSRHPSTDSVAAEFKSLYFDNTVEVHRFEERLANATLPEEVCWFYHELSRLHLEMKRFDVSRIYAKKCIQEATSIDNKKWIFNSFMLLCKNHMAQRNKNDAILKLHRAIKCAETLNDHEKIEFCMRCIDVVTNIEFVGEFGITKHKEREKSIVRLMQSQQMKGEMEYLLKAMATVPISRRMTLGPGMAMESKEKRKSCKGGRMSIMPTQRAQGSIISLRSGGKMQSLMSLKDYLS